MRPLMWPPKTANVPPASPLILAGSVVLTMPDFTAPLSSNQLLEQPGVGEHRVHARPLRLQNQFLVNGLRGVRKPPRQRRRRLPVRAARHFRRKEKHQ